MKKTRKTKKVLIPLLSVLILTVGLLLTAVPAMAGSGTIGDFVWEDLDCDGVQDTGEPGIADVTVKLFKWYGCPYPGTFKLEATTWTDSDGFYEFSDLDPGKYYVEFVAPEGCCFSPKDDVPCNDEVDSDAYPTGKTDSFCLSCGKIDKTWDAGLCCCDLSVIKTATPDVIVPSPPPNCDTWGKPTSLTFKYTGGGCDESDNEQGKKAKCSGDPGGAQPVQFVYTGKKPDKITVSPSDESINVGGLVTVEATGGKTLPSNTKLEIRQNGNVLQSLEIHTSCSQPLEVGNVFGSLELVAFNGHEATDNEVTYTYVVTNNGADLTGVTVVDDLLGPIAGPFYLAHGDSWTATAMKKILVTTTNEVTVKGRIVGNCKWCEDSDTATVTVLPPPPPLFECDGKIIELTMIWDGTQAIHVKAWKGKVDSTLLADIDNVNNGAEVTISGYAGAPNDVIWELFEAGTGGSKIGESKFHLSCSDKDMNGPEDCGKPQGDGKSKKNKSTYINEWLLEGMVDSAGGILDCTT